MMLPETAALALTGLLGVVMVAKSAMKVRGDFAEEFERYGYPEWLLPTTAALELIGGAGLLVGLVAGELFALGGGVLAAVVLVGALTTHVRVRDPITTAAPSAVLLALTGVVLVHHAGALG